ncbi:MAG: hypothetical protein ACHQ50_07185 [Fimbriimonadales bacterium]
MLGGTLTSMEERGFDALTKGEGAVLLVASTILLFLIIIAGGLFFRYKEIMWRKAHSDEEREREEALRRAQSRQS